MSHLIFRVSRCAAGPIAQMARRTLATAPESATFGWDVPVALRSGIAVVVFGEPDRGWRCAQILANQSPQPNSREQGSFQGISRLERRCAGEGFLRARRVATSGWERRKSRIFRTGDPTGKEQGTIRNGGIRNRESGRSQTYLPSWSASGASGPSMTPGACS